MAATYLSPGVYVEEVPSAVQAIAGAGTNTVGFIGYVPKKIDIPEPLTEGELTKAIQDTLARLRSESPNAAAAKGKLSQVDNEIKTLRTKIGELETQIEAAAREHAAKGEAAGQPGAEKKESRKDPTEELNSQLQEKRDELHRKEEDRKKLEAIAVGDDRRLFEDVRDSVKPYKLPSTPFEVKVGPCNATLCTSFAEYVSRFGSFSAYDEKDPDKPLYPGHSALTHAVYGFFNNGGGRCFVSRIDARTLADVDPKQLDKALADFESIDAIAIVAAPGLYNKDHWNALVTHCETCKDRFAILDCPPHVVDPKDPSKEEPNLRLLNYDNPSEFIPQRSKNAAFYFPYIEVMDPAKQLQDRHPVHEIPTKYRGRTYVPPSGHVAGIYARVDNERGVHAAPANRAVLGAIDVQHYIGKGKQDMLNPQGVNCIRNMNGNIVVYGARTIGGDLNGEWKYVNVRRTFLFIAESIDEGTQWVVFEPNDRMLWGKIRRNVSAFLTNVWRTGALFGATPEEAFYVKCDDETNPPEERELGRVITEIGVAIVRPAEFVIFRITQATGQNGG